MNRVLIVFNLLGVLVLSVLCAIQWKENSRVNLRSNQFELTTQQQRAELDKDEQTIKTCTADLEDFRTRLNLSEKQLKELDEKLSKEKREKELLIAERDQLKASLAMWMSAVAERDKTIIEARDRLNKLAADRNDVVVKLNDLTEKYNSLVKQWNAQQAGK